MTSLANLHLDVSDLAVVRRGNVILEGVAFSISRGVTILLGENGAGKTTLLRSLAGLLPPRSGTIELRIGSTPVAPSFGYQPQGMSPTGLLTVESFIEHVAWLHRVDRAERRDAVDRAIRLVDLDRKRRVRLDRLSGGELRRATIAQAVVHRPHVLLLDEPSAGLDPVQHARLRDMIRAIAEDHLVLLSTHQVDDVIALSDRVLVLKDRTLTHVGTVEEAVGAGVPRGDVGAVGSALVRLMQG